MVHSPAVLLLAKMIILLLAKPARLLYKQFSHKQLSLSGDCCVSTTGTDESVCGCSQPPEPIWAHKNAQIMDRLPPCPTWHWGIFMALPYFRAVFFCCSQRWYFRPALQKLLLSLRRSPAPFTPSIQTLAAYPTLSRPFLGIVPWLRT